VCTSDGVIFDNAAITPHLMRHGVDPVTGNPMTSRDLIVLNMDRDESTGRWQCPVLNRPFTDRTAIVAIRQRPPGNEANVYSREAYRELNVKARSYVDLTSGMKFDPKADVIVLQDPDDEAHCRMRDIRNFTHIRQLRDEETRRQEDAANIAGSNVTHSVTATRIMEKLDKEKRKRERAAEDQARKLLIRTDATDAQSPHAAREEKVGIYTDELLTSVSLTSGKASGSLTSTTMAITRENKARLATEEEIIASQCEQLRRLKKKGMVRIFTNMGAMDVELHCDIVPRTTMNFLLLARGGEYDGCKFHRSIPNFMIQGGKKPGIKGGDGGSSAWEKPFADEFDDRLKHSGPGVMSMANSGPGTNGRQFFITYKSCAHLDRKHSVFGRVVGGLEILRRLEEVPTDKETDRPLETVKIESIEIIDNPLDEALQIERERIGKRKDEKLTSDLSRKTPATLGGSITGVDMGLKSGGGIVMRSSGPVEGDLTREIPAIGKYLLAAKKDSKKKATQSKSPDNGGAESDGPAREATLLSRLPPPPKKTTFGDFSGW
jgi:peptidyl-prolyl cis-trans isomerase-like protein 2